MPKSQRTSDGGSRGTSPNKRRKTGCDKQSPEIPVVAKTAPDDDWQVNKPLSACLGYLQEKSHLTDVTFIFPSEEPVERLDAHKLILAARSPMFEAMFYGLAGGKSQGPIKISHASSKTFKEMLKFIYTDGLAKMDTLDLLELLQVSHYYRIDSLTNRCCSCLEDTLHWESVLTVLEVAIFLDFSLLQQHCLMYIDRWTESVLFSDSFETIKVSTLYEVIKRNSLTGPEIKIYTACINWAEAECVRQDIPSTGENKRKVLGSAFQEIRFQQISSREVSDKVSGDGVLTDKQLLELLLRMTGSDKSFVGEFVDTPRVTHPLSRRIHTAVPNKTEIVPICRYETVKLSASEDIFLSGFVWDKIRPKCSMGLYPSLNVIKGTITFSGGGTETVYSDFEMNVSNRDVVVVKPKRVILLKGGIEYKATIDLIFSNRMMERSGDFTAGTKLAVNNGAEVIWSSNNFDNTMAINSLQFYPWI